MKKQDHNQECSSPEISGTNTLPRLVVCAALRYPDNTIICGVRHFDPIMCNAILGMGLPTNVAPEQGFVDQYGQFINREEAYQVATNAIQIRRVLESSTKKELYSENLY